MAYTPGFDYDIFISFSHQDNEPRPGQTTGWVERFVDYLKWWLSDRRGLTGLEVWWDKRRLTGVTELDSRIERDLGRTALLVVLHSENYRDSEYCEQELSWFVAAARSQPLGLVIDGERCIFNVLIDKISHEEWTGSGHWTQPLAGTLGFEFHDAADDQDTFGDPIKDADPARYDAAMRPIVDAATRLLKAFPAPQDDPESQSTGRPPGDPRVQRERIIVIDPHPVDQHYGFELAAGLTRRAPALNLEVTRDGAEPAERWTDFEQLVERARGLIVVSGNVDPQWVQKRIERAAKIAAAQLGGDMMLETIWVARLQDGLSGGIPQPQLSLPPLIRVRILDDTDIGGILEAVVEHTARPRDEEERTERQSPISNPFVGLRPFGRADSRYYFGRDTQIQTLLTSLHRNRFLAVGGSSGCGKSSLIRAGLIPALEASDPGPGPGSLAHRHLQARRIAPRTPSRGPAGGGRPGPRTGCSNSTRRPLAGEGRRGGCRDPQGHARRRPYQSAAAGGPIRKALPLRLGLDPNPSGRDPGGHIPRPGREICRALAAPGEPRPAAGLLRHHHALGFHR